MVAALEARGLVCQVRDPSCLVRSRSAMSSEAVLQWQVLKSEEASDLCRAHRR
jgi:hypothetical protein